MSRRGVLGAALAGLGWAALEQSADAQPSRDAPVPPRSTLKITRLETFLVKPRSAW